ncbi:MAG: hypothetical protein HYT87_12760 [Nitrospirae bacterium]|nr:hypothetical protein [Nitrospirota bacterium]
MQVFQRIGKKYTLQDVRLFFAHPDLVVESLRSETCESLGGVPLELTGLEDYLLLCSVRFIGGTRRGKR